MTSNANQSRVFSSKKECNYGENCYRRNPNHFKEFGHRHLEKMLENQFGDDIKLPSSMKAGLDRTVILEQLEILAPIFKEERNKGIPEVKEVAIKPGNKNEGLQTATEDGLTSADEIRSSKADTYVKAKDADNKTLEETQHKKRKNDASSSRLSNPPETSSSEKELGTKFEKKNDSKILEEPEYKKRKGDSSSRTSTSPIKGGGFLKKWEDSLPYNFFLTTIYSSPKTRSEGLSITFRDLLDESLGTIESSLQINFMVELDWVLSNYHRTGNGEKPLLILYGVEDDDLKDKSLLRNNVRAVHVKPPHPFGHHHTKMSLFRYNDGSVRVVVSTANLIESDWMNRTQGIRDVDVFEEVFGLSFCSVWVGPRCPPLPANANSSDGDSVTNFRMDLIRYLSSYRLSCLTDWIGILRKIDFSGVKVCFVSSSPGSHKGPDIKFWGHMKAGHLLRSYAMSELRGETHISPWPLIIQCSSIGSLGADASTWMCGEFRCSLSETAGVSKGPSIIPNLKVPSVKVVYPSLKNVSQSYDDMLGGACLPYSMKTHVKQTWLSGYLHQWRSEERFRSRAMPHIKTYTRWCPGHKLGRIGWFILTSANLSKAAWGSLSKNKSSLYIMSYEAGILFLPHFFLSENEQGNPEDKTFPLSKEDGKHLPPFPMPYDIPLTPYAPGDKVWQVEYLT
ncbi:hypothetical protein J437_LFUL009951 [Ladona fulva]|uniref:PBZ-type domain-containing protein n=1 Tax=Ladona fulva TaxID=123851 RepID=A0A8K0K8R3_LADFU|nr:hypothetical protein J437_LFUL009951 [Ladona fulva]